MANWCVQSGILSFSNELEWMLISKFKWKMWWCDQLTKKSEFWRLGHCRLLLFNWNDLSLFWHQAWLYWFLCHQITYRTIQNILGNLFLEIRIIFKVGSGPGCSCKALNSLVPVQESIVVKSSLSSKTGLEAGFNSELALNLYCLLIGPHWTQAWRQLGRELHVCSLCYLLGIQMTLHK